MEFHEPVMVQEVLEVLQLGPGMTVADGTMGTGGHCLVMARLLGPKGRLIGLDRDPEMMKLGSERLKAAAESEGNFPAMEFAAVPYEEIVAVAGKVDGILLDLGINSLHLEKAERGFSFMKEGPLDGRFNPKEGGRTVADLVNNASERDLATWLWELSDERLARKIAKRLATERRVKPIETTTELAAIVADVYPPKERHAGRIHPATRTFQALRIVCNDEMGAVRRGIDACMAALVPGGRLAVITFHSGEDRLVKQMFRAASEPRPDPSNPYSATTSEGIEFELPYRQAIQCSDEEAARNARARSAKLRVIRRREVA